MKRKRFYMILLSLALTLTACSGGKEEQETEKPTEIQTETETETETEYQEEIPSVNALDEKQPIPADTGTLELTEQRFESANLILQLPEGATAVEGEPDELYGYVTVMDDGGEWELRFEPFLNGNNVLNNVAQNWYVREHIDGDPEAETELFSKKVDWSEDVSGTIAGYQARIWANNTALAPYEPNPLDVPAVDIVVDYGEQYVGRYYGMYIRLQFQHPVENDNIYEILYRRAVRAIINNFSVIEGKESSEYTANGVTVSLPARWSVMAEKSSIVANTRGEKQRSFITSVNPSIISPEETAAAWGEVITKEYGERTYSCVIYNTGTEDEPKYSMSLYTDYDEEENLILRISAGILGASEDELSAYLDQEDFVEIMESVRIDPSAYSDTTGAKAEGMKVQYGSLIEYTGTEEHVVVPSEINGFTVEEIGINAFRDNTEIKSIELPDTITWIDHHAFEGCTSLETIILPESITMIDIGTFEGCTGIETIILPESVTVIGDEAFEGCTSLKDIVIPAGVEEIGRRAFYGAGSGSFEAKGAVVYGEWCFGMSGFESIILADGSDLSATDIFRQSEIRAIRLPSDLTVLGKQVFYYCESLEELILPDTVTEVGEGCFSCTRSMKKLTLSNALKELPKNMCSSSAVVNLSIPESVETIREYAVEAGYVFLYNKEVELEDKALYVYYLYLDGADSSDDVPQNIENQIIYRKIFIPVDQTIAISDALDEYYVSLGMDSLSWFGPSEALTDKNTEDYHAENNYLVSYTGDKKIVNIPAYTENGGSIAWILADAFAGNENIEGITFTAVNSIDAYSFQGCAGLKQMWFGMASFSFLDEDDTGVEANAFTGIPDGVTVYFPDCLTEEELQRYEQIFREKGMPESTVFDTFSLVDGSLSTLIQEEETEGLQTEQYETEEIG